MVRGLSRTDSDARLVVAMLVAFVVAGAVIISVGFDPLSSLSSAGRLSVGAVMVVGFFEGVGLTYLLLRSLRRKPSDSLNDAKPLCGGYRCTGLKYPRDSVALRL